MNIVVVEFVGRGGMIHYAFQLCRALHACGADVTLITARDYELQELPHGFEVVRLFKLWNPKPGGEIGNSAARALLRKARRFGRALIYYREWLRLMLYLSRRRPSVLQFGDIRFPTDIVFFYLLRLLRFTMTDICHNVHPFASGGSRGGLIRSSRILDRLYKKIYSRFQLILVHHSSNRLQFLRSFALEEEKVVEIPLGNWLLFEEARDPEKRPEALRRDLCIPPESPVVLLFGTLNRYKGVDILLKSFATIHASRPDAFLVIAGFPAPDFDLKGSEQLAEKLHISGAVRFVTAYIEMDAVAQWMELAAVAVFPYRMIFQSGASHVAQSFGVPTVATTVGSFPEIIRQGESGLLVPPDDPAALADAVLTLLKDKELARRMGRKASEDARDRFAWEKVAEMLMHHYDRLVRAGGGTSCGPAHGPESGET